jgi:hypothetical protein
LLFLLLFFFFSFLDYQVRSRPFPYYFACHLCFSDSLIIFL